MQMINNLIRIIILSCIVIFYLSSTSETMAQVPTAPTLVSPANGAVNQPTTITFTWNSSAVATEYHLQVSTDSSFTKLVADMPGLTITSQQVSGLTEGVTYYWHVNSSTVAVVSDWSSTWGFTTAAPPPPPPLSAPTLVSPPNGAIDQPTNITFNWNSVQSAAYYHFQLSTSSAFSTLIADDSSLTQVSKTVNSLSNSTTYYWRVNAYNSGNTSPWSQVWSFTTAAPPPPPPLSAPVLLSPADSSKHQPTNITFMWDSVQNATNYHFQLSTISSFSTLVADVINLTKTSYTESSLSKGQTYFWRTNANNSKSTSPWSENRNFTTDVPPDPPVLVSPPDNSTNQPTTIVLKWNPSANASEYRLQVSTDGSFNKLVFDKSSITTASYEVSGLLPGTIYYWHVNASSLLFTSGWSSTWSFTTTAQPAPAKPTLASPQNNAVNQPINLTLTWNQAQGANTYYLQLSNSSTFNSLILNDSTLTGTSRQTGNLNSSSVYYWRVAAKNAYGTSPWSDIWNFSTQQDTSGIPLLLSPPDGSVGQPTTLNLIWSTVKNAKYYHLQVSKDSLLTTFVINADSLADTTKNVSALETATVYFWRVSASFLSGPGKWSNISRFKTFSAGPSAPILLSPKNGTTNQSLYPILSWNSSDSANHYQLQVSTAQDFGTTVFNDSTITATYTQIGPLKELTKYFWRAKAFNNSTGSGWSAVWNFTTLSNKDNTPTLLSPPDGSKNNPLSVLCDWDSVSGATLFNIRVSITPAFDSLIVNDSSVTTSSRVINNLKNGVTYFWDVRAKVNGQWGQFSAAWSFSTTVAAPKYINISTNIYFPTYNDASQFKSTDYKLVGIPGISNIPITAFLKGTIDKDWTVYWDNGDAKNYLIKYDGKTDFVFSNGAAFWILKNGPLHIDTTVQKAVLDSANVVKIPLHNGWNIITNPTIDQVSWAKIKTLNSISELLYSFNGSFQNSDLLSPYSGYYFFNATGLSFLKIPTNDSTLTKLNKDNSMQSSENQLLWRVGISLTAENNTDSTAWLGVSQYVNTEYNRLDVHKPHSLGSIPYVFFSRPEWDSNYSSFASDIRPVFNDYSEWTFNVSSTPWVPAVVKFNGIDQVPPEYKVFLVELSSQKTVDLRKNGSYSYIPAGTKKLFKIVVGKEDAVKNHLKDYSNDIPTSFKLGYNYPNPFNNSTTFNVYIPLKSDIEIEVFNVIGNQVTTIYKGELNSGIHTFRWNGTDNNNNTVSSGIYLFRLTTTSGINLIRKMILLK